MPPPPPAPTTSRPTPAPVPIAASVETMQQQSRLQGLREALHRANVSQATADQIVSDQQQAQASIVEFFCHVRAIGTAPAGVVAGTASPTGSTTPDLTWVSVEEPSSLGEEKFRQVQDQAVLHFPPNDTRYLAEFVRAQNYALDIYLSVTVSSQQAKQEAMINYLYLSRGRVPP